MSWKRIHHPNEIINVGDEITVKVLKFDRERKRVSLGLKQLGGDPWTEAIAAFPKGKKAKGKVTNIADYGCFVEIHDGVEGLVHVSEMDWTNKNANPNKIVQLGQEVEVVVLDIDEERRRISLGLKQCTNNPWEVFAQEHKPGDKVKGKIKSITDFGVFLGLSGDIDGLIHLSDLSWDKKPEEAVREFNKGDEVETLVLGVDVERGRISLGIKQLQGNYLADYTEQHKKGTKVTGIITEVDEKGAYVKLTEDVKGYIRASDISRESIEDARQHLKVDSEVEACVVGSDRKQGHINLSIRALDEKQEKQAAKEYNSRNNENSGSSTTIGDLIKEKMNEANKEDKK